MQSQTLQGRYFNTKRLGTSKKWHFRNLSPARHLKQWILFEKLKIYPQGEICVYPHIIPAYLVANAYSQVGGLKILFGDLCEQRELGAKGGF
ncbi:hypothetical protein [Helicobacter turcicus]|uniref:Uncharacterized protein n=1 Tax=Helicobacter turcicus TaxID=2867412 RepID=A0ABS7JMM0_9HELI|nr:hypothetical protein [Helicobacter turcicus]MBX7490625.1 hypothetical protein [Helicobacter turcicus]MBX7545467.1 hypothetical protein [Helicobacter turcicus]